MADTTKSVEQAYALAKERYAEFGVDCDRATEVLKSIPISLHCWQGDDVGGFENTGQELGGGLAVTGNYPGKARTPDELRADLEQGLLADPRRAPPESACQLRRVSGDVVVERDQIGPEHFQGWIDWARAAGIWASTSIRRTSLTKRPNGRIHARASATQAIRQFWIEHGIACREIGAAMGEALGNALRHQRLDSRRLQRHAGRPQGSPRAAGPIAGRDLRRTDRSRSNLDAVEAKLFGIGSESYVVGSHEFYLGYAIARKKVLCLDAGHFHPTEVISDKISSVMMYVPELLLHVSRGVRWDSDHVVTLTDELQAIAQELVRGDYLDRMHIGLDFFDASINRVAAWVIGTRNMIKALLMALLEPIDQLQSLELDGDFTSSTGAAWKN